MAADAPSLTDIAEFTQNHQFIGLRPSLGSGYLYEIAVHARPEPHLVYGGEKVLKNVTADTLRLMIDPKNSSAFLNALVDSAKAEVARLDKAARDYNNLVPAL